MTSRNLNYIKSPKDTRDHLLKFSSTAPTASLPPSVDLSQHCTPVKDQGQEGSCTAFSSLAAMEYIGKKFNNGLDANFSEKFTYYVTRVDIARGRASQDSGAYVRDAIKSTVSYGTCLENTWPYSNSLSTRPSSKAYTEAKKYESVSYTSIRPSTNINLVKTTLSQGIPVVIGFTCYSNIFDDSVEVSGIIPLPNNNIIGGHAVLVVGYDDATNLFKFKNSWGTSWGVNGYGYLPYQYYNTGDISELWCVLTQTDNNKLIGSGISVVNKTLTNTQIAEVLNNVAANISVVSDKTKYISFFNTLLAQYPNNPKISILITNLRNSFLNINS